MATAVGVRGDYSASDLRRLARKCGDAEQVRWLLAVASILDGGSRSEAAIRAGPSTSCQRPTPGSMLSRGSLPS